MDPVRHDMVGWYDLQQLARTGAAAAISTLLGTRADNRVIEALATTQPLYDFALEHDEVLIDYVADLGDGYASTLAVARAVAQTPLPPDLAPRAGRVLLFGGDQVYPTAGRREYHERLVEPWQRVYPKPDPKTSALREAPRPPGWGVVPAPPDPTLPGAPTQLPYLFAIPGNHDWYDGLVSFSRLLCQRRTLGGLRTCQSRSYFALRLPGDWWVLALDVHLEGDMDRPQLDYFCNEAIAHMKQGDRALVCVAEPGWEKRRVGEPRLEANLAFMERKVNEAGGHVHLWIAGDLHYYRRYESEGDPASRVQKLTCGGGGAFLHPTHTLPLAPFSSGVRGKDTTFTEQAAYPDRKTSRRLSLGNLLFPILNRTFGLVPALLYVITGALAIDWNDAMPKGDFGALLEWMAHFSVREPIFWVWTFGVVAALTGFADARSKASRLLAGVLHAGAHLGVAALLAALVITVLQGFPGGPSAWMGGVAVIGMAFMGAWVVGSFIMGLYLMVMVGFFGRHTNEGFSALAHQGYKSFMRFHVRADGSLQATAHAVEHVSGTSWLGALLRPGRLDPHPDTSVRLLDRFEVPPKQQARAPAPTLP